MVRKLIRRISQWPALGDNQDTHKRGRSDYRYDGLNQRITRIEPSTGTTEFYYNGKSQVLTETDGSGAPKAIYSYWRGYI